MKGSSRKAACEGDEAEGRIDTVRIILFGPPGSGKGTQAESLCGGWGLPQISTGDILREAIRIGSPTGMKARDFMDRGELVSDGLMTRIVEERLSQKDCAAGFVLDGFPRTIAQAEALEAFLRARGDGIDAVASLRVEEEELVRRMADRGRDDDSEAVIRNRLDVYRRETEPLVRYFRERGKLIEIDGMGRAEDITERIRSAVADVTETDASVARGKISDARIE
jgi:adenylate kinase